MRAAAPNLSASLSKIKNVSLLSAIGIINDLMFNLALTVSCCYPLTAHLLGFTSLFAKFAGNSEVGLSVVSRFLTAKGCWWKF